MADDFDALIGDDLQRRRSSLDDLDLWSYVEDRAVLLELSTDGVVTAHVVLAGPDGPSTHARDLDSTTVERLASEHPTRWLDPTLVLRTDVVVGPGSALLDAWAPTKIINHGKDVAWAALLLVKPNDPH